MIETTIRVDEKILDDFTGAELRDSGGPLGWQLTRMRDGATVHFTNLGQLTPTQEPWGESYAHVYDVLEAAKQAPEVDPAIFETLDIS